MNRKSARQIVTLVALTGLLFGCAPPAGNKAIIVPVEAAPEPAQKGLVPQPSVPTVWPLTGVVTAEVADRPALSVKIENSPQARPQTGLADADVVWEEMVEGGITRFNAVFHSTVPDTVGPIRSLRPMDAAISGPYGGLFVASGGQARFVSQVAGTGLTMLTHDGGAAGFYRGSDRPAPHNVYGRTDDFLAAAQSQEPPATQFEFARVPELATAHEGGVAERIVLAFPSVTPGWTWDGETYLRDEAGAPARTTDGGQIGATNIVVVRVQVRNSGARDPAGNPVPESMLTGSGDAIIASAGFSIEATWTKPDTESVLELALADGSPVLLAPGNTWVEMLPVSGASVSVS